MPLAFLVSTACPSKHLSYLCRCLMTRRAGAKFSSNPAHCPCTETNLNLTILAGLFQYRYLSHKSVQANGRIASDAMSCIWNLFTMSSTEAREISFQTTRTARAGIERRLELDSHALTLSSSATSLLSQASKRFREWPASS